MSKAERKVKLLAKCKELLTSHTKIVLVNADNVGSSQMAKIRAEFYKIGATLFMGKNTLIRKALREVMSENPELTALQRVVNEIKLNVGLVFVQNDLAKVNDVIKAQRRPAPARAGALSPVDVIVPAGPTGMEPTMTSFLQALNISSKIMKGQVEILADVHLIKQGTKVGGSEATLLQKLKILPFSYGLQPQTVYDDGSMFPASVLDLKDEDVLESFMVGAQRAKGLALAASVPCDATVVPFLLHGYREKVLALALGSGFIFKQAEKIKEMIDNPDAFAAAAPAAAAAGGGGGGGDAPAAKKEEKEEEEEEDDMGFGLFD